jgi:hypothetical protein
VVKTIIIFLGRNFRETCWRVCGRHTEGVQGVEIQFYKRTQISARFRKPKGAMAFDF